MGVNKSKEDGSKDEVASMSLESGSGDTP